MRLVQRSPRPLLLLALTLVLWVTADAVAIALHESSMAALGVLIAGFLAWFLALLTIPEDRPLTSFVAAWLFLVLAVFAVGIWGAQTVTFH